MHVRVGKRWSDCPNNRSFCPRLDWALLGSDYVFDNDYLQKYMNSSERKHTLSCEQATCSCQDVIEVNFRGVKKDSDPEPLAWEASAISSELGMQVITCNQKGLNLCD